jgi:hypothetical protein
MKTLKTLSAIAVMAILFSSCGVVTKARYGNGLKLNLGERWAKTETPENKGPQTKKAAKKWLLRPVEPEPIAEEGPAALQSLKSAANQAPGANTSVHKQSAQKTDPDKTPETPETPSDRQVQNGADNAARPMEPNVKIASVLFYGPMIIFLLYSGIIGAALSSILGLCLLIAFVLAWIGLSNIKQSFGGYAGKGMAISIIVLFILMVTYVLIGLLFWLLLLAILL